MQVKPPTDLSADERKFLRALDTLTKASVPATPDKIRRKMGLPPRWRFGMAASALSFHGLVVFKSGVFKRINHAGQSFGEGCCDGKPLP